VVCTAGQIDDAPSWWEDLDCLMAIDLGYDESGAGDTLLVSVQLGITNQAKKLRRKWKGKLRAADVEYFHAKEFDNFSHGVNVSQGAGRRSTAMHRCHPVTCAVSVSSTPTASGSWSEP